MLHKHKCGNPHCALVFEHEVPDTAGLKPVEATKKYNAGHMCPRCKTGPWLDVHFENSKEREKYARGQLEQFLDPLLDLFKDDYDNGDNLEVKVFHL